MLWAAFLDLDRWRGTGGLGPSPLTLADLAHYEARTGLRFCAEALEHLKRLDALRLAALAPKQTPTTPDPA